MEVDLRIWVGIFTLVACIVGNVGSMNSHFGLMAVMMFDDGLFAELELKEVD